MHLTTGSAVCIVFVFVCLLVYYSFFGLFSIVFRYHGFFRCHTLFYAGPVLWPIAMRPLYKQVATSGEYIDINIGYSENVAYGQKFGYVVKFLITKVEQPSTYN